MQFKVGQIIKGVVVKIAKFGAFIKIGPQINGLVHISEISDDFVDDIAKFLSVGDEVDVKILSIKNEKIALSIKQVQKNLKEVKPAIYSNLIKKSDNKLSFEEMLSKFKKNSEEKLSNLKYFNDGGKNFNSKRR